MGKFTYLEEKVYLTLGHSGKKSKEIQWELGIDSRTLEQTVRDLRLKGVRVCSGNQGYWISRGDGKDWEHTKAQLWARIKSSYELLKAMENAPSDDQIRMEI